MKKIYSCLFLVSLAVGITACSGETEPVEKNEAVDQEVAEVAPASKLNINLASEEALKTIPNVGDKMVYEFKEYRPYVSIREFRKEIGKYVDEARVTEYEKYIYVPISYSKSDAATLMQIPGLEKDEADKLTSNRPFESKQAFIQALSSYINEQQMETAKFYLKDAG